MPAAGLHKSMVQVYRSFEATGSVWRASFIFYFGTQRAVWETPHRRVGIQQTGHRRCRYRCCLRPHGLAVCLRPERLALAFEPDRAARSGGPRGEGHGAADAFATAGPVRGARQRGLAPDEMVAASRRPACIGVDILDKIWRVLRKFLTGACTARALACPYAHIQTRPHACYIVIALYSYGSIWLWLYILMRPHACVWV